MSEYFARNIIIKINTLLIYDYILTSNNSSYGILALFEPQA